MAATDYFEREMDNFIRGYTSVSEELQKNTPKEMHRLLQNSYKAVSTAPFLGKIEKKSTLVTIKTAIDEFQNQVQSRYPELCI